MLHMLPWIADHYSITVLNHDSHDVRLRVTLKSNSDLVTGADDGGHGDGQQQRPWHHGGINAIMSTWSTDTYSDSP